MDERLWICLWMVGGGGLGAVLGGAFGALAGTLYAHSGGAAGTGLARRIVENFLDRAERQPTSTGRAALIGAADGFLFLGIVGLIAGALLGMSARGGNGLVLASLGCLLLGGAAFFGTLAYSLVRNGLPAIFCVFLGGVGGTFLAGFLLGADNCLLGTVPGLLVGLIFSLLHRRYAPRFQPPRAGNLVARHRLDTDTDITGSPHSHRGNDALRKPDVDGEP